MSKVVIIDYSNYRGERRCRPVRPLGISFMKSKWHEGEQWILHAIDMEDTKDKEFSMKDIHEWVPTTS